MARWSDKYQPAAAMVTCQLIIATTALLNRAAIIQGMSPVIFVVYRQATATFVICPIAFLYSLRKEKGRRDVRKTNSVWIKSFLLICVCSLFGGVLNPIFYAEGLYYANSSVGTAIANVVPAITFIMAFIFRLENVNIRSMSSIAKITGTVVCVGGALSIALLKGPKLLNDSVSIHGGGRKSENDWLLGCMFFLANSFCLSLWLILLVPVSTTCPNPLSLSAWFCFISTLQSALVALAMEKDPAAWRINSTLEISSIVYSGVAGSGLVFFLQSWCVSERGPLYSATFNPLCTVIATILASVLLHEEIYIGSLLGSAGVILRLYLVLWGKSKEMETKLQQGSSNKMIAVNDDLEQTLLGKRPDHDHDDVAITTQLN